MNKKLLALLLVLALPVAALAATNLSYKNTFRLQPGTYCHNHTSVLQPDNKFVTTTTVKDGECTNGGETIVVPSPTPSPVALAATATAPSQCDGMTFDSTIVGTAAGEELQGNGKKNLIIGNGGGDKVFARGDDDCIEVEVGSRVEAGNGDDIVVSHGLNAVIIGGAGYDKCYTNNFNGFVQCEEVHPL